MGCVHVSVFKSKIMSTDAKSVKDDTLDGAGRKGSQKTLRRKTVSKWSSRASSMLSAKTYQHEMSHADDDDVHGLEMQMNPMPSQEALSVVSRTAGEEESG